MAKKKMTPADLAEIKAIVARERPGYCVVSPEIMPPNSPLSVTSDQSTRLESTMTSNAPNLEYLRRKFLGQAAASAPTPLDSAAEASQIIQIAPTTDTSRAKRKAIVISGKRIIGEQG